MLWLLGETGDGISLATQCKLSVKLFSNGNKLYLNWMLNEFTCLLMYSDFAFPDSTWRLKTGPDLFYCKEANTRTHPVSWSYHSHPTVVTPCLSLTVEVCSLHLISHSQSPTWSFNAGEKQVGRATNCNLSFLSLCLVETACETTRAFSPTCLETFP